MKRVMRLAYIFRGVCLLLLAFSLPFFVQAQASSSSYELRQQATSLQEHDSSSTNYQLKSVIGGLTAVTSTSTNYLVNQVRSWLSGEDDDSGSGGSSSGGGGGGSSTSSSGSSTGVSFSGRAYPRSRVELLKDGQVIVSTVAGADAYFSMTASGFNPGSHTFLVIGEDASGYRSDAESFFITLSEGSTTRITGIYLAPTLSVDKKEVKQGDNIAIFGQTVPESNVTISVHSPIEYFRTTDADEDGVFLYNFDTTPLNKGGHQTKAKSAQAQQISEFGKSVAFIVGDTNVLNDQGACPAKGDLNTDCRVNLVDFSIAAFWYKKPLSETFKSIEAMALNGDGQLTIVDFSVMAFYWTG